MSKIVLLDSHFEMAANDFTDHVSKIEIDDQIESKDVTTYGSSSAKEVLGGLESYTVSVTFKNDYASGSIDDLMWTMFRTRTPQTWKAWPKDATVSTSNPMYSGSVLITNWKPISGSPGDVAESDISMDGSGALVRSTST